MRQLIPHGAEDAFTTDEIWMAHYLALVDVHVDAEVRPPSTGTWELPPTPHKEPVFGKRWLPESARGN